MASRGQQSQEFLEFIFGSSCSISFKRTKRLLKSLGFMSMWNLDLYTTTPIQAMTLSSVQRDLCYVKILNKQSGVL